MLVRRATLEDARGIAEIHVSSWQAGYDGVVPQAYLASLSVDRREAAWREILTKSASHEWVVDEGDGVLGWISVGASRDADAGAATGELWAIYVSPKQWRRGIGRELWSAAKLYLASAGFSSATVWVLKQNEKAIAFYVSLGFTVGAGVEKTINLGGALLTESRLRRSLGDL